MSIKESSLRKATTALMLLVSVLFAAQAYAQQIHTPVKASGVTLSELFKMIEKNSDYVFLVLDDASGELKKKVSIDGEGKNINEILKEAFAGSALSYEVNKRQVSVFNRKKAPASVNPAAPAPAVNGAQDVVTGIILDKNGTPLEAGVTVKGTQTAAQANSDGYFSIPAREGQTLVFHYMGSERHELVVGANKNLTVVLPEMIESINEVVIIGYGEQRKITVTGAVASIKTKEIKQSAVSNLSNALVGRLPGLLARQSKGEVGGDGSTLRLRGTGTYGSQKDPLIMIDGVPREGFQFIDPNEVESITILKDASATAVYGVKGANGVILITTRRGEASDKPKITVNFERAFSTPLEMLGYLDSEDYFRVFRRGLINDGSIQEAQALSSEFIARYSAASYAANPDNKYLYPNVDWTGELLRKWSHRTTANVNVSGGNTRARYFVSGSFFNESGLYNHTEDAQGYNPQAGEMRFNFRSNVDIKLNSWLSTDINLATIVRRRNYPGTSGDDIFTSIRSTPSYDYPMLNPDGSIGAGSSLDVSNPYGKLVHSGYEKINNSYLQGTVGVNADLGFLLKGLSAKVRFSYDAQNSGGYKRTKNFTTYQYLGEDSYVLRKEGDDYLGYSTSNDNWSMTSSPELYLTYATTLGSRHNISAMLLYRSTSVSKRSENSDRAQAAINALPYREQGLVGRITYGYADKYLAEFNFGFNGSENFAPKQRFGFFPAVSLSWVISEEGFVKNAAGKWLEMLKVRGSVGQVGNADPGTRFAYQSRWSFNSGSYSMGTTNQNSLTMAEELAIGNAFVTWETATKYNAGIDIMLKRGMFGFTGDIFYEYRTGIFDSVQATTSALMGWSVFPKENAGIVENRGFEFEVWHRNNIGSDFTYEVKGSYTFTRNKILKAMEAPQPTRPWLERTGKGVNEIKTYQTLGLFQTWAEVSSSASQSQFTSNLQPGDIKYYDLDGDNVLTIYDQSYIGKNSEANQILGMSLQLRYKNFDVAALFQGALGRNVFISGYALFGSNYEMRQIFSDYKDNYWTPENPGAKYPRAMGAKNTNNTQQSTFWLKNGNYVRLKNVELGYTIPTRLSEKLSMRQLRVYVNGSNLITWDKLDGLFDPEEDNGAIKYPLLRTFNAGLTVTF